MPLLTPNVPKGLIDLMKSLTKEVLRDKPENIYEYAAVHFEKQLCERDGSLDKDYELFSDYKASFEGQQQFVIPGSYGFKCQRTPRGSASRRSKPDILASFKVMESIHEEDASAENLYSDEKYQKAIYVIQRYYRRYLARKNALASADSQRLTEATAAIIIQRTMRKLFANKFPSRPGGETVRHGGEVPQEDVDNVSEAASYTSSSTIQMLADSQEGRENRLTPGREEIADDNGVAEGDGSASVTHEPSAGSPNHHTVAGKEKQEVDRKSMDHENDGSALLPHEESSTNPLPAIVSDDTSTAPIGILSTKIGSNDQQNSVQTNTVEVAKNSKNSEPTQVQTPQDVAPVELYSLAAQPSLGSTPETAPVAPASRQGAEKTFAVRLQSNAFVDNNAGYSVQSVGPNRKFTAETGDAMRAYSVFYQDGDDPDFSDSLNESTMEKDSLETEDLDVDSLESNDNTSHVSGIVKREIMQVPDDPRDVCEGNDEDPNAQLSEVERVPSYLYGIHPKRSPLPQRKSVHNRTAPEGENLGPDEKSEEESLESKGSTSEESSATQIENIVEPQIEYKQEALLKPPSEDEQDTKEEDTKEARSAKSGKEDTRKDGAVDVSNHDILESKLSSPSSSAGCASDNDDRAKLGYFETLYNVDDTTQSSSGHQDSEVESQLKDLRSLCNLYPGLEIKDIISEFHTKHIQPGQSGKDSVYDDNNNVEDFDMKSSDTNAVDDEEDTEAFEDLYEVDESVERVAKETDKDYPIHSNANETVKDVPKEEESVNRVSTEGGDGNQEAVNAQSGDKNCVVSSEGEIKEKKEDDESKNSNEATEQNDGPVCEGRMNELAKAAGASSQVHDGELDINNKEKHDQIEKAARVSDTVHLTIDDKGFLSSNSHEKSETKAEVADSRETENREILDSKSTLSGDKVGVDLDLVKTSESPTETKANRVKRESNLDEKKETSDDKWDISKENEIDGDSKYGETGSTEAEVSSDQPRGRHEAEHRSVDNSPVDSIQKQEGLEEGGASNEAKADKSIKVAKPTEEYQGIKKSEHIDSLDAIGERNIGTTGGSEEVKGDGFEGTDSLSQEKTVELNDSGVGSTSESAQEKGGASEATDSLSVDKIDEIGEKDIGTTGISTVSLSKDKTEEIEETVGTTQGSEQLKTDGDVSVATDGLSEEKTDSVEERAVGTIGGLENWDIGTTGGSEQEKRGASEANDGLSEEITNSVEEEEVGTTDKSEEIKGDDCKATDSLSELKTAAIEERDTRRSKEVKGDGSEAYKLLSEQKTVETEEKDVGTTGGSEQLKGNAFEATDSFNEENTDKEGTSSNEEICKDNIPREQESKSDLNETADPTADRKQSENVKEPDEDHDAKEEPILEMNLTEVEGQLIENKDAESKLRIDNGDNLKHSRESDIQSSENQVEGLEESSDQEKRNTKNTAIDAAQMGGLKAIENSEKVTDVETKDDVIGITGGLEKSTERRQEHSEQPISSNHNSIESTIQEKTDAQVEADSKRTEDVNEDTRLTKSSEVENVESVEMNTNLDVLEDKALKADDGNSTQSVLEKQANPHELDPKTEARINMSSSEEVEDSDSVKVIDAEISETDVRKHENLKIVKSTESVAIDNRDNEALQTNENDDVQTNSSSVAIGEPSHDEDRLKGVNAETEAADEEMDSKRNLVQETIDQPKDFKELVDSDFRKQQLTSDKSDLELIPSKEDSDNDDERMDETGLTGVLRSFKGDSKPHEEEERQAQDEADRPLTHDRAKEGIEETGLTGVLRSFEGDSKPHEEDKREVEEEANRSEESIDDTGLTGVLISFKGDSKPHEEEEREAQEEANRSLTHEGDKESIEETGLTGVLRSFKGDQKPHEEEKRETEEAADRSLTHGGGKEGIEETGLTGVLRSFKGDPKPHEEDKKEAQEEANRSEESIDDTGLTGVLISFKGDSKPHEEEEREAQDEADRSLTHDRAKEGIEETGLTGILRSFEGDQKPHEEEKRETEEAEDRSLTHGGSKEGIEETGLTGVLRSFKGDPKPHEEDKREAQEEANRSEESIDDTGLTGVLISFKGDSKPHEEEEREAQDEADRSLTHDRAKEGIEETGLTGILRSFEGDQKPHEEEKRETEEAEDRYLTHGGAKEGIEETGLTGVLRSFEGNSKPHEEEEREAQEVTGKALTHDGAKESIEDTGLTGVLRSFKGDSKPHEEEERETQEEADRSLTHDGAKEGIEETGLTGVLRSFEGDSKPHEEEEREAQEEANISLTHEGDKESIEETGLTGVLRSFKGDSKPHEKEEREAQEEADRSLTPGGAKECIEETGLTETLRSFKLLAHDEAKDGSTNNKGEQEVDNIDKTEQISLHTNQQDVELAETQISNEDDAGKLKQSEIDGNGTESESVENMDDGEKLVAVESHQSGEVLMDTNSTTGDEAHEVGKRSKRSLSNGNFNENDYDKTIAQSGDLGEQREQLDDYSQDQENDPSPVGTSLVRIFISHAEDCSIAGSDLELVNGEGYKTAGIQGLSGDSGNDTNSKLEDQEKRTAVHGNDSGRDGVKTEGSGLQSEETVKLDDATVSRESNVAIEENKERHIEEGVDCEKKENSLQSEDSKKTEGYTKEDGKGQGGSLEGTRSQQDKDEVPNESSDHTESAQLNAEDESKEVGNEQKVAKNEDEVVENYPTATSPSTKDGNQERNITVEDVEETAVKDETVEGADSANKAVVEHMKEAERSQPESKIESCNRGENIQQEAVENDPIIARPMDVNCSEEVKACKSEIKSTQSTSDLDQQESAKQYLTETLKMFTLKDDNKFDNLAENAGEVNGILNSSSRNYDLLEQNDTRFNEELHEVNGESVDETNEKGISSKTRLSENVLESEMQSKKDEYSGEAEESVIGEVTLSKITEFKEGFSRGIVVSKMDELKEGTSRGIHETVSGKDEETKDDTNPIESADNLKEDLTTESRELKVESTEEGEQNISDDRKRTSTETEESITLIPQIESPPNERFKRHLQISGTKADNDPSSSEKDDAMILKKVEAGIIQENTNLEASSGRAAAVLSGQDKSKKQGDDDDRGEPKSQLNSKNSEEGIHKEVISNETTLRVEDKENSEKVDQPRILPESTEEDHDKSVDLTATSPSTEVTGVDENTAETSADFSSIGKDLDFFEDTIHYLKSATSQLTAIEGLFDKTKNDENVKPDTLSQTEENLNRAAVVIQSAIRGFRVRRAFKRNLSCGRKKGLETDGAGSSIPVAIIHPTKHLTENEKAFNQDVNGQAIGRKPEDDNKRQPGGRTKDSEIPRLKRERPLERKMRLDESVSNRTEAKIKPVKAKSLEETHPAKPRLTREKPIERNSRTVKGGSVNETTRKETMRTDKTTEKQKTSSGQDKTKVPTSRVVSSSNLPERHRLIKSKRDQFAKKGKSLSTNAQTQKPLVFDLEAIKKDLLSKKTVSQASKKTRAVTRKDPLKERDSSKRDMCPVNKLDDISVLDQSNSRQSSASARKDKLEKDSVDKLNDTSVLDQSNSRQSSASARKDKLEKDSVDKLNDTSVLDQSNSRQSSASDKRDKLEKDSVDKLIDTSVLDQSNSRQSSASDKKDKLEKDSVYALNDTSVLNQSNSRQSSASDKRDKLEKDSVYALNDTSVLDQSNSRQSSASDKRDKLEKDSVDKLNDTSVLDQSNSRQSSASDRKDNLEEDSVDKLNDTSVLNQSNSRQSSASTRKDKLEKDSVDKLNDTSMLDQSNSRQSSASDKRDKLEKDSVDKLIDTSVLDQSNSRQSSASDRKDKLEKDSVDKLNDTSVLDQSNSRQSSASARKDKLEKDSVDKLNDTSVLDQSNSRQSSAFDRKDKLEQDSVDKLNDTSVLDQSNSRQSSASDKKDKLEKDSVYALNDTSVLNQSNSRQSSASDRKDKLEKDSVDKLNDTSVLDQSNSQQSSASDKRDKLEKDSVDKLIDTSVLDQSNSRQSSASDKKDNLEEDSVDKLNDTSVLNQSNSRQSSASARKDKLEKDSVDKLNDTSVLDQSNSRQSSASARKDKLEKDSVDKLNDTSVLDQSNSRQSSASDKRDKLEKDSVDKLIDTSVLDQSNSRHSSASDRKDKLEKDSVDKLIDTSVLDQSNSRQSSASDRKDKLEKDSVDKLNDTSVLDQSNSRQSSASARKDKLEKDSVDKLNDTSVLDQSNSRQSSASDKRDKLEKDSVDKLIDTSVLDQSNSRQSSASDRKDKLEKHSVDKLNDTSVLNQSNSRKSSASATKEKLKKDSVSKSNDTSVLDQSNSRQSSASDKRDMLEKDSVDKLNDTSVLDQSNSRQSSASDRKDKLEKDSVDKLNDTSVLDQIISRQFSASDKKDNLEEDSVDKLNDTSVLNQSNSRQSSASDRKDKLEQDSVDKLNDTSVLNQNNSRKSSASATKEKLKKDSVSKSNDTSVLDQNKKDSVFQENKESPTEGVTNDGEMKNSVDLATVEMLVQEALIDKAGQETPIQRQNELGSLTNAIHDKSEKLLEEATQDNLNETSDETEINECKKESSETRKDPAENGTDEEKQECPNEQASQGILSAKLSATVGLDLLSGLDTSSKEQVRESLTTAIAEGHFDKGKAEVLNKPGMPQIVIHRTADSPIHSSAAVDTLKDDKVEDANKDQFDQAESSQSETGILKNTSDTIVGRTTFEKEEMGKMNEKEVEGETPVFPEAKTEQLLENDGKALFVTDAVAGVEQISELESKPSKDNGFKDESSMTQVTSTQHESAGVKSENLDDKDLNLIKQNVATNELEINDSTSLQATLSQSKPSNEDEMEQLSDQSQLGSSEAIQGDLNKPATMIQKTFRGYNTRKNLNNKNPKNKIGGDQEKSTLTQLCNSLTTGVDSISNSVHYASATVIQKHFRGYRTRRSLQDASKADAVYSDLHSPANSKSMLSLGCVEPQQFNDAAVMIQKTFRGYKTRKELSGATECQKEDEKAMNEAAVVIQKSYKGYKTRRDLAGIQKNDRGLDSEIKRGTDQSEDSREKGYKTPVELEQSKQRDEETFEPSSEYKAAPHSPNIPKSTSAHALLESAAETIQKAYRDYHGQSHEVPMKSYSHGAQRDHASKEAVENSDESSIFMGPDTSFDLSDVESVDTKSEQVSDTATYTLQDESLSDAHSKTPIEEPQRDNELQPERSSLSVESGIRRKRSIIDPTAPALEDILKSDEPVTGTDGKPQWYVGDDLIVPTDAKMHSTSQQNSLDSTSSSRFDNSCSIDARLDFSDKQPTPSIQSAVVSTSSLLFPNDAEMHDTDTFKQLNTKPSRAVSADKEESSAREDEEKEKEIEENAEEQMLDADTARDGSGSSEKGEHECKTVLGADPFSVVIKIEDLDGLSMDNVREIEAEVCKSCAEGMHGAGLSTASPRRKSIEEISREIDEQATNLGDTKDADAADDSADENLDKIKQFVLMEEANKASTSESHTDDQRANDNNCNKSHNDPDLAGLDEPNKMGIKGATGDSKISGIPSEGGKDEQEAFVENALEENGHEGGEQSECPAITLIPPSSEDDVSDKGGSDGGANDGVPKETACGAKGDGGIGVSSSHEAVTNDEGQEKVDEQSNSTEQSEAIKVDKSDKVTDEAHIDESRNLEAVDKQSENDIPPAVQGVHSGDEVKELDESNTEAQEVSSDLNVDAEGTPANEVQAIQSFETVDKETSQQNLTVPLKKIKEPVPSNANNAGVHSKEVELNDNDSSSSSHKIHLKRDDESNKSTDQNNDDASLKASEDQTEGGADSMLCEKSLETPLSEDKDSVSLNDEKSDGNQSKAASSEPTEDDSAPALIEKKTSDEQSEKLDSCPSTELNKNDVEVNSTKEHSPEQSQATSDQSRTLDNTSQDQEVLPDVDHLKEPNPAEKNPSPTQEKLLVPSTEPIDNVSTLEEKLEKLIDDSTPLTEKDSVSEQPQCLPTENSSQEVVEEPCIKRVVPSSSEQEDSEIESTTTKAESTTTSVAYDEASENETLDSPPSLHDTLEKATESLRESEAVVARMHLRRDSEQKASLDHVDQFPIFGDIACEPVKSMQELQKPSSPEVDDDIILQGLQRGDTTRESSAQSESIVFGNSSSQLSESDDFFNENADIKAMHRMNTIAVDHGTYRAPSMLFKSVTIDDTVKYIDPEKSTEESGDSFCLDDALTADVRKKMMAYSVSEADSDYYEPGERTNRLQDDFNISTTVNRFASSDTDTTIISAATKIQAGARGFLTRRRLRRASMGTRASLTDGTKASFGNDAIGESLDRLVEEEAHKRLPKVHYQRQVGVNSLPSALGNAEEPEIVHSTPTRDELSMLTATAELLAPSSENTSHGEARYGHGMSTSSEYDVNGGIGASIDDSSEELSSNLEATLAARRLTLQRGDAMRNDSTPDSDNGNDKQVEQAKITTAAANTDAILIHESAALLESAATTNTEKRAHSDAAMTKKMEKIKWFAMRQNSMPVQIDSEVFRVLPKHMRKRIKSAEGQQKKRIRLPRD